MRLLTPVLLVAGFIIGSKLLFENLLGVNLEPAVRQWMTDAGTGGALAIVALLAIDIVLPVPSSLVMILSGAVFGVGWGAALALVGSIAGEWLGFEAARAYGPRLAARLVGESDARRLGRIVTVHGAAAVAASRALPIVMETVSVVAGLSGMRRATFLGASLVGTAPVVVAYAYAGAASREAGTVVPAIIMTLAVCGVGWIVYRARLTKG